MTGEQNLWTNNVSYLQGEWASVSEPHTSVFNVELCLYRSLISHTVTATMCAYCPAPFIKQLCPTVRPHLSDTDRGRRKRWLWRLGTKEPPCCTAYALLPPSHSPHNVLHSPVYHLVQCPN